MYELRIIFRYHFNEKIGDEFKTDNKHIIVAVEFSSLQRKDSCPHRVPLPLSHHFLTPYTV